MLKGSVIKLGRSWFAPIIVFLAISVCIAVGTATAQQSGEQYNKKSDPGMNRSLGIKILQQVRAVLKEYYFDKNFNGIDLEKRVAEAEATIKTQDMNWQIYRTIAQLVSELNDSHTIFFPPDRRFSVEYGFSTKLIGNSCFVVDVKRGSDAEAKGLKAGDQVAAIGGITPDRANLAKLNYIIYGLDPQETLELKLIGKDKKSRELTIKSRFLSPDERRAERKKLKSDERSKPYTCEKLSSVVVACKLRTFEVDVEVVDRMMKTVAAYKKMILDLRGNQGGYVETSKRLIGHFFEQDVKVGTTRSKNKTKDEMAKSLRSDSYKGELTVLIDRDSASSSEVFARTIQLQKRGKVVGDTSAGAVMTALAFGLETPIFVSNRPEMQSPIYVSYLSVSVADFIGADGERLEGVGVIPDIPVGRSPLALEQRTDPVLAHVAGLFGVIVTPEAAGNYYFLLPKSEDMIVDGSSETEKK